MPYRNCALTSVLRDAIGPGCRAVLIATVSPDAASLDETLATCRFAQRCGRVRIDPPVDPPAEAGGTAAMLAALMAEVAALRARAEGLSGALEAATGARGLARAHARFVTRSGVAQRRAS